MVFVIKQRNASYLAVSFVLALTACTFSATTNGTPYDPEGTDASTTDVATADTQSGSEDDSSTTDAGESGSTGEEPEPYYGPAVYPPDRIHSPITSFVADRLHEVISLGPRLRDDVFLKAGASTTVNTNALYCFAGDDVDLADHDHLEPTLAYFLGGDAAGTTSFDRDSFAAEAGRSAGWCIDGDPSPLDLEVEAIEPRLALVHYGSNDMNLGATYESAAYPFYANMSALLDQLMTRGSVPIVFGITRRGDSESAQLWVATYNAILRGLAQARQVPFVDAFAAIDPLPGHGLSSDGLHLEGYDAGSCILTAEGLEHGYNARNLIALEVLDRAVAVLVDDVPELDGAEDPPAGDGTPALPYPVLALPFSDPRDTTEGASTIDAYPACDDADESGPEVWYRLELDRATPIRALVLDLEGVDVDVHLLEAGGGPDGCIARGDRVVEGTLDAGAYDLVVDTWSSGVPFPGEFLLVVAECDPGDTACETEL
jgi:hypothetical protein